MSEDWRFIVAVGKVEFNLLHLNLVPLRSPHIHESSYVVLGRAERRVPARISGRAPHKPLRDISGRYVGPNITKTTSGLGTATPIFSVHVGGQQGSGSLPALKGVAHRSDGLALNRGHMIRATTRLRCCRTAEYL